MDAAFIDPALEWVNRRLAVTGAVRATVAPLVASLDTDEQICRILQDTLHQLRSIMISLEQVLAEQAALKARLTEAQAALDAKQEAMAASIASMQAIIAAGGDQTKLAELVEGLADLNAQVVALTTDITDTPVADPTASIPVTG